jgi:hypothetical protein
MKLLVFFLKIKSTNWLAAVLLFLEIFYDFFFHTHTHTSLYFLKEFDGSPYFNPEVKVGKGNVQNTFLTVGGGGGLFGF